VGAESTADPTAPPGPELLGECRLLGRLRYRLIPRRPALTPSSARYFIHNRTARFGRGGGPDEPSSWRSCHRRCLEVAAASAAAPLRPAISTGVYGYTVEAQPQSRLRRSEKAPASSIDGRALRPVSEGTSTAFRPRLEAIRRAGRRASWRWLAHRGRKGSQRWHPRTISFVRTDRGPTSRLAILRKLKVHTRGEAGAEPCGSGLVG